MTRANNYKRLNGMRNLITGATSGLGFSISVALAKEGAEVIAIGRNKKRLEDLSDTIEQVKGSETLVCVDNLSSILTRYMADLLPDR